jgi:hypothetical protein
VAAALQKIITHISNPRRFKKAAPLLRQLLGQGIVTKAHAGLLFEVRTAFSACNLSPHLTCMALAHGNSQTQRFHVALSWHAGAEGRDEGS